MREGEASIMEFLVNMTTHVPDGTPAAAGVAHG